MTAARVASSPGKVLALVAGLILGAAVTLGAVLFTEDAVRGDAPLKSLGAPRFVDESAASGVGQVYDGEFEYFVGGGAAVFDCNGDVFPDLYLAGGSNPAGLYVNRSRPGGVLEFESVGDATTDLVGVTGAYPLDIESDGITDLAVLRVGENVVLRGLGDCQFQRANEDWGIDGGDAWTAAFSATWEPGQALPTLAFGNYLARNEGSSREACDSHSLVRPDGAGYGSPSELAPGWCTLSILFSDWSGDGRRDLRMTNDRHYYQEGEEQLWRVTEASLPEPYTTADGWRTMQIWGMGIASHDITGDGLPEVYLTSQGDNKLQTLESGADQPTYDDMALAVGATAHRPFLGDTNRPSTAWHAEFGDVNSDGFMDLFVTKGNVDAMQEFAMEDPNNLMLGQPDGTFSEGALDAGVLDYSRSRGGALSDLNLDGHLDMLVVERREPVKIWRNTGDLAGNWVALDLSQEAPNRDAIGSWVEVRIGSRVVRSEVVVGGGHAGGESGWLHSGLGTASGADVRVTWPDGERGPWIPVDANHFSILRRGADEAETLPDFVR